MPFFRSSAYFFALLILGFGLPLETHAQKALKADLDPIISLPGAYDLTPEDLEKMFEKGSWNRNPYFKWLTKDKSRAIFQRKAMPNLKVDLSLLGGTVPIEEAIVDFKDGKYLGTTISIYNWGDYNREKSNPSQYEEIQEADFQARFRSMGKHLGEQLATRPTRRTAKPTQGVLTSGYIWISARGKAVLEHNPIEDGEKKMFLRMRLARRDAEGAYEAATQARPGATARLSDLPRNVRRRAEGDVYVANLPMVDQGAKGYCVVASAQRLFEYYGIPCDMHQLGMIAGSDPERGTSSLDTNRELGAIDHLFKTRFECLAVRHQSSLVELKDGKYVGDRIPNEDFHKMIRKSIDEGIPLLWSLELGRYPEEPPISQQTSGGHMRMIIGYNDNEDKIIFSDSWGAGHEFKKMDAAHALSATQGLFLMKPIVR
ncbi:MAG: C39 family peptidase [Verrucomicrobiales bacterium]|nr:C39 family peptidase [Verrucomicrobiales bacterium]